MPCSGDNGRVTPAGRISRLALALAAALALADASIVTLGLPSILSELDTTVEGVALVLGVYTAVLAVALLPMVRRWRGGSAGARRPRRDRALRRSPRSPAARSDSIDGLLLVLRGVQAVGGGGAP